MNKYTVEKTPFYGLKHSRGYPEIRQAQAAKRRRLKMRQIVLAAFLILAAAWNPESSATDLPATLQCESVNVGLSNQSPQTVYSLQLETPSAHRENATLLKIFKKHPVGGDSLLQTIDSSADNAILTSERVNNICRIQVREFGTQSSTSLSFTLTPDAANRTVFADLKFDSHWPNSRTKTLKLFCQIDPRFYHIHCPTEVPGPQPPKRTDETEMIAEEPATAI